MARTVKPKPVGRRYAGTPLEKRRAQRRRRLIRAGIAVFGTRGFHASTVRGICAGAGLTERYFYESFASREELFSAAYEHLTEGLRQKILEAVNGAGGDLQQMARAGLRAYFEQTRRDPRGARIMLIEVFGVSRSIDHLSRRTAYGFAELIQQLATPLVLRARRGRPMLDPALVSTGLIGAVIFGAMRWVISGYRQPLESVVENTLTIFTGLLRELGAAPAR